MSFLVLIVVALIVSAIGFKKYVWFISLGYGFSMTAIGIVLLVWFRASLNIVSALLCLLMVIYGLRLGGYLAYREIRSASYNRTMDKETKSNDSVSFGVRIAIWITCALLYAFMAAPVYFRLANGAEPDAFGVIGIILVAFGIGFESLSDIQKQRAKAKNPHRFVDTGLFCIVRCPNYLGELINWTGMLISCLGILSGALQWVVVIIGWLGIVYVMFSGARRLEVRQNRNYGDDPTYQRYCTTVPIMIPFVPLYSVEKHTWLIA